MPAYVSASGFVEVEDVRPKVGDSGRGPHTLLLLDRLAGRVARIDLGSLPTIDEDPLAELRAAAERREQQRREAAGDSGSSSEEEGETGAAGQGAEDTEASEASEGADSGDGVPAAPAPGRPRPVSVVTAQWSADGGHVAVQLVSHDNKDRWVAVLAPDPGADAAPALRSLLHDHDPAWINWSFRDVVWHPGGDSLLALSERSGFSQLYRLPLAEGASPVALTTGDFVVDELQLSSDGQWAYFTANVLDPGAYDVFRVATSRPDAADAEELSASGRVSDKGGLTSFVLSPDDRRVLLLHSTSLRPPELFVQSAEAGAGAATQLTSLVSDEYLTLPWVEPRIVDVPATHPTAGNPDLRPIRARLFLPDADRFPAGDRPAAFFVHGAGYLQNAHRGWSSYFRETMFSSLLAQRGYVVLDMDYRGSAGYGRDWRTAIYRQMGTPEVEDLEDGVRYVAAEHGVDPQRVGVWGGSYGGFLTFMAMFRQPELFAAGAALRPVTDWAHYNHPYTSNILNTPELDPEAYERSSPIEFAQGLEKPLLICTGMLDDNVFFQDSVRLVQRLIELEKTGWEIAIYPVEPHGFLEPSSWLDEYRRILELFEEHVRGVCDCAEGP
ncbi:MAG: S9 family peptidase [Acidobacteria bacterium]|nr:MAG: S9 family peptidase [Acidobacteriota bacterium]REK04429.1 MAG: S9 family peptidase [Acidobacteriota bacterium]